MWARGRRVLSSVLRRAVRRVDGLLGELTTGSRFENGALVGLMFHQVYQRAREVDPRVVDPFQPFTVDDLRQVIEHFLAEGYRFVLPADLLAGVDPEARCALLSFDDAYASTARLLPLLDEYGVGAVLFVSTRFVDTQESFWWDVLHRERWRRGASEEAIEAEKAWLKTQPVAFIDQHLREAFGAESLRPLGDLDRCLSRAELLAVAAHPRIELGNHTVDHAILTAQPQPEVVRQIREAQQWLAAFTGRRPAMVSYPDGAFDRGVVEVARQAGLPLGVTAVPRRARLPLPGGDQLSIGRYYVQPRDFDRQLKGFRCGVQIRRWLRW